MIKNRARELRNNPTEAERKLWAHLRLRQIGGYKFRRQHPLGPYIVDFVCIEKKLMTHITHILRFIMPECINWASMNRLNSGFPLKPVPTHL